MSNRFALALALSILGGVSCSSKRPIRDPVDAFYAADAAYTSAYWYAYAELNDESVALALNQYATAEMLLGNYRDARSAFVDAGRVMGNFDGSSLETLGAVIGQEQSKRWKGDPYEVAMNSFYAALLYYARGEYDNALAGCKNGILAGGDADEGYQSDFTLLYWFEGKCLEKLGKSDAARQSFDLSLKSRERRGDADEFQTLLGGDRNTTFVIDLGIGPRKFAGGDHGELVLFRRGDSPEAFAEVRVDGRLAGRTIEMVDLFFQATHRGGREIDGIREGKAIFKTTTAIAGIAALIAANAQQNDKSRNQLALAGAGLLLLSVLTSAEADTRCWLTLPDAVHALVLDLEPGLHTIEIDFFDERGASLPGLRQVWHDVPIASGRENLFYFRSGPRRAEVTYPAADPDPSLIVPLSALPGMR
jgi:hypothetical protein